MSDQIADAVVVGAGPNGLVAANALADAGWDVVLVESADDVGGAVRTAEVTAPGFRNDLFSAFYPLAAASRIIGDLELDRHGLQWVQAPKVMAHAFPDGRAAVLERSVQDTADGFDGFAAGDGAAFLELFEQWQQIRDPLLDAMFTPLPPIRSVVRLLRRLGTRGALDLARLLVLPVRRLAAERFAGEGAAAVFGGNALHADVPPDAAGSAVFGWLLVMLGQDVGFPVPQGGAQRLPDALRRRFESLGGQTITGFPVVQVLTDSGRAVGVRGADGQLVRARRAVVADVAAPTLYRRLLSEHPLPAPLIRDLDRFQWDNPTLKVNWALGGPLPWTADGPVGAGTVHYGLDADGLVDFAADLSVGRTPRHPLVLLGQMTTADPSRSPAGTESVWAYTHVPKSCATDPAAVAAQVEVVEEHLEQVAPGFRDLVLARHVQSPGDLEAADANLVGGALNGGTSAPHQQLFFRPTPGLGRPETVVQGLYLASASAHPGGGVHGACGWNAALAALRDAGPLGPVRRRLQRAAWGRLLPSR